MLSEHALRAAVKAREVWLPIDDLCIDYDHYQRGPVKITVGNLLRDFDPNRMDRIWVNRRADGSLWVPDGGCRVYTMREVMDYHGLVPCNLLELGGSIEEARQFDLINGSRVDPKASERFRAKLHAQDPSAVQILGEIENVGLVIEPTKEIGSHHPQFLGCTWVLRRIYEKGGIRAVRETLRFAVSTGKEREKPLTADFLWAIFVLWNQAQTNRSLDWERMRRLAVRTTWKDLEIGRRHQQQKSGCSKSVSWGAALKSRYNRGSGGASFKTAKWPVEAER